MWPGVQHSDPRGGDGLPEQAEPLRDDLRLLVGDFFFFGVFLGVGPWV